MVHRPLEQAPLLLIYPYGFGRCFSLKAKSPSKPTERFRWDNGLFVRCWSDSLTPWKTCKNLEAKDACQSAESATRGEAGTNRRKGQTLRVEQIIQNLVANVAIRDQQKKTIGVGDSPKWNINWGLGISWAMKLLPWPSLPQVGWSFWGSHDLEPWSMGFFMGFFGGE